MSLSLTRRPHSSTATTTTAVTTVTVVTTTVTIHRRHHLQATPPPQRRHHPTVTSPHRCHPSTAATNDHTTNHRRYCTKIKGTFVLLFKAKWYGWCSNNTTKGCLGCGGQQRRRGGVLVTVHGSKGGFLFSVTVHSQRGVCFFGSGQPTLGECLVISKTRVRW
nr:hypothetical protein [Tanacetum cinerariifolium]